MTWKTAIAPVPPSRAHRLLGGPPLTVLARLVFVSLIVGALLVWLDVEPMALVHAALRAAERLWAMGFDAFGQAGRYVLAGAVVVLPVWFVMRVLTVGGTARRRQLD
jgi:hypothetical protein